MWIGKVLDELVDNAVKHTPGGPITLTAALAPGGQRVRVAVRDAGPGVAPDKEERLFTSFEQADGSATRRVGGLGLGLGFVARFARERGLPLSYSHGRQGRGVRARPADSGAQAGRNGGAQSVNQYGVA